MPTPQEFMEMVVAWPGSNDPGYVNLHWTSAQGPGMRGRPFRNIQEFMSFAQWGATKPSIMRDIYFCLSTQAKTGAEYKGKTTALRLAENALTLKSIWLDIDVKNSPKSYKDLATATDELGQFLRLASLPSPSAIVLSGGGMHVYWCSTVPLEPNEWFLYANGLKAGAMLHNLRCDYGVTTDAARVLRVPGSLNFKTNPPNPVRVAGLGQCYDFTLSLESLRRLGEQAGPVAHTQNAPFDLSAFPRKAIPPEGIESLSIGIETEYDNKPLDPKEVFRFCPHFRHVAATKGKDCGQGLWMLDVLSSTFFEEGQHIAHYISKGHKDYSKDATDHMYGRKLLDRAEKGLGWPSCGAFEAEGSTQCGGCPYRGKIKSPLNLAKRADHLPPPPAAAVDTTATTKLSLPAGFVIEPETGRICELVRKKVAAGMYAEELEPLFMCRLSDPWAQAGNRCLRFTTSLDMDNANEVVVYEEDLATEQGLMKALRKQGVKPYVPNKKRIEHFMTSWMDKLDAEKARINTIPFGWMSNGDERSGFVYGGNYFQKGGQVARAGYSDEKLEVHYRPRGSIGPWQELMRIVTARKHPALEAIIATSFAAPLMFVPGLYNGIFCAYSDGSGAHKTTSMALGCAVWGNPVMVKENTLSSVVGLLNKMGHLRNLPIYWDEITDEEKMEMVRGIVSLCTEGRAGTKLFSSRDFRDVDEWQTMITIGANTSLYEQIIKKVKHTDAQLQRVFEFEVEKRKDSHDSTEVQRLVDSLNRNFGQMGLRYAEFIGRAPDTVDQFAKKLLVDFRNDVGAKSEERYRSAMAAMTVAGAALANQMGATFDIESMYVFLKKEFFGQRDRIEKAHTVGGSRANTAVFLSQFFKAYIKNTLITENMHNPSKGGRPDPIIRVSGPDLVRADAVHIHGSRDDRIIRISRTCITAFADRHGFAWGSLETGMRKYYKANFGLPRINLAAGSGIAGMRESVIELPVPPGSELEDVLFGQNTNQADTNYPKSNGNGASHPPDSEELVEEIIPEKAVQQAQADLAFVRSKTE